MYIEVDDVPKVDSIVLMKDYKGCVCSLEHLMEVGKTYNIYLLGNHSTFIIPNAYIEEVTVWQFKVGYKVNSKGWVNAYFQRALTSNKDMNIIGWEEL